MHSGTNGISKHGNVDAGNLQERARDAGGKFCGLAFRSMDIIPVAFVKLFDQLVDIRRSKYDSEGEGRRQGAHAGLGEKATPAVVVLNRNDLCLVEAWNGRQNGTPQHRLIDHGRDAEAQAHELLHK